HRRFSPAMVERFFRPWLGGIFLERELVTPAAMLFFVYRMFAEGHAALPTGGMARIPEQLASGLKPGSLRLRARVANVHEGEVELADGERVRGRQLVVATEADAAATWFPKAVLSPGWRQVTCVQWAAPTSPFAGEPLLWLNGTGQGRINNIVVPSDVSAGYAPTGRSLVSATILGDAPESDATLGKILSDELASHFGPETRAWHLLAVQRVRKALPILREPGEGTTPKPLRPGLWLCGDHMTSASIQGAMANGEAVAAQIAH
ncbi:MAG TPA: FAD-dependent oxidoreductase, partial [Opitutaceae bacterium]|nr:FAD-dependent oxidoreductase [Opitutaceae bacterium]